HPVKPHRPRGVPPRQQQRRHEVDAAVAERQRVDRELCAPERGQPEQRGEQEQDVLRGRHPGRWRVQEEVHEDMLQPRDPGDRSQQQRDDLLPLLRERADDLLHRSTLPLRRRYGDSDFFFSGGAPTSSSARAGAGVIGAETARPAYVTRVPFGGPGAASPSAPRRETARTLNCDSTATMAAMSLGSTPWRRPTSTMWVLMSRVSTAGGLDAGSSATISTWCSAESATATRETAYAVPTASTS